MKKQIHIALIFAFAITGSVFFSSNAHAASTTSIAGTVANADDTISGCTNLTNGIAWGTTLSAYQTSNNTYGSYGDNSFDANEVSTELQLSNFHFSIPNGSTINGIRLTLEHDAGGSNDISDLVISLSKTAGTATGSNYASTTAKWSNQDETHLYGGSADLWGTTWSEAEVEASGFGVVICVQTDAEGANEVAKADLVGLEITYTEATPALTQDGYRWRANHQGETGTTWLAAEDTVVTGANNTTASTTRLRILVDETASTATTTLYQLEYATSTSAGCSALTYVRVADQASSTGYAWKMSPTAQFANGGASTNIADPNGLTDTTGSFRAGVTQDTTARISSGIAHAAGEFTELEWSIEAIPRAHVTGQSYCFRVTNADDTTNITYSASAYPKINLATSSPALSQLHYRWRANHKTETGATWLAAEDIPILNVYTASTTRLRMLFDETSGKTGTTTLYQVEYATSTITGYSGCSALSTWVPIPMTASSTSYAWIATSTAQLVNRGSTTNVASGLNDPSSGLFTAGQTLDRNSTTTPLLLLDGDNFTEIEWTLQAKAEAEGDSYCFRATNADSATNITYSVYPRISIATSTFTQSNFRIYKNTNNITPSTAWDNLGINGSMLSTTTSERIGGGDEFRLRMNVTVGTVDLPPAAHQFSLQYAELSSGACSALAQASWKNTGAKDTSIETFTFVDNLSVADTATISDVTPLSSNVGGLYQEVQNTTANPTGALEGRTVEYDWALKYPSARYSGATFCFRMAKSDGSAIVAYGGYPRVLTNLVGAGNDIIFGAPTGGGGAKGVATTTGGTQGAGGEEGGTPPGGGDVGGGTPGGGGEVWIPFFRYFASALGGVIEFVVQVLRL